MKKGISKTHKQRKLKPLVVPIVLMYLLGAYFVYNDFTHFLNLENDYYTIFIYFPRVLWIILTIYIVVRLIQANYESNLGTKVFIIIASVIFSPIIYTITLGLFLKIILITSNYIYVDKDETFVKKYKVEKVDKYKSKRSYKYRIRFEIDDKFEDFRITENEYYLYKDSENVYVKFNLSNAILNTYKVNNYKLFIQKTQIYNNN